jgi:hypothetical protein
VQPVRAALGDLTELSRIEHIESTGVGPAARTDVQVTLTGDREAEPEGGEIIFDWAVSQGFKLVGLERKRYSLEDIFTTLTTGEGQQS